MSGLSTCAVAVICSKCKSKILVNGKSSITNTHCKHKWKNNNDSRRNSSASSNSNNSNDDNNNNNNNININIFSESVNFILDNILSYWLRYYKILIPLDLLGMVVNFCVLPKVHFMQKQINKKDEIIESITEQKKVIFKAIFKVIFKLIFKQFFENHVVQ